MADSLKNNNINRKVPIKIRKVTLENGLNKVIYTDTEGGEEYVPNNIELYHNGESIGTIDQIKAANSKNEAVGTSNIFSKNGVYLGTVEDLKYAFSVKVPTEGSHGGARKSLRKRKNKKSRKGKSRKGKSKKNRRKSNRRR